MKEFIDKLIERLEEEHIDCFTTGDYKYNNAIDKAKEIVKGLAEEHKGGWIPVSERLPDVGVTVLAYGKRYDQHDNTTNYYYIFAHRNEKEWWFSDFGLCDDIIAWQPLPAPYEYEEVNK